MLTQRLLDFDGHTALVFCTPGLETGSFSSSRCKNKKILRYDPRSMKVCLISNPAGEGGA